MSEQRGASVEDEELSAEAGRPNSAGSAESRVPVRHRRPESDEDFEDDDAALVKPSGKRARRKAVDSESDEESRRPAKEAKTDGKSGKKGKRAARGAGSSGASRNPFAALVRFLREVVSELSKVIWPQRRQLISYMVIVMLFVTAVVAFVAGLDIGFAKLILKLLG